MIVAYNIYWVDGKDSPEPYHPEYDPFNTEFIGLAIAMAAVSMDGDINDNILRIYRSDYFKDNIDDRCFILSLQCVQKVRDVARDIMHSMGYDGPLVHIDDQEWGFTKAKTFTMEFWRVMHRMSSRETADLYDSKQVLTLFFQSAHLLGSLYGDKADDFQCDYIDTYPKEVKFCTKYIDECRINLPISRIIFKAMLSIGGDLRKALTDLMSSERYRERFMESPDSELRDLDEDKEVRELLDSIGYDIPQVTEIPPEYGWDNIVYSEVGFSRLGSEINVDKVIDSINSRHSDYYWKILQDYHDGTGDYNPRIAHYFRRTHRICTLKTPSADAKKTERKEA